MFRNRIAQKLLLGSLIWVSTGVLWSAETEEVDIHVSIAATKSLSVSATSYNYGALTVNQSSVTSSAIVVTNDSTALMETYTLSATNAISDTGGTDWTLNTSTGPNQYSLGAQFSDARPSDSNAVWNQDNVSTGASTCTADVFGNGSPEEAGVDVLPGATRNLWFRIKTPSAVTDGTGHTITVTLSVL